MEFRILGPLEVEDDGRLLSLGGAKQRALLALLLLHANEVVPRERLIDALWDEDPPQTAQTALQVHVSQLRKLLRRDLIVTRSPGYLLRVEPGQLDLERFQTLVGDARGQDPATAAERLRAALALWRGAPLAELEAHAFARRERLRLEELRLDALEKRIQADLVLGRHSELVPELEQLVAEQPLRERLRVELMLALYRVGRQADALEVFRRGRRLLSEELGLEPGEELKRLEKAILAQDPAIAAATAAASPEPTAHKAPTGTVTFVFTDVEGSTRLVRELGDEYGELLEQHRRLLRSALGEGGGHEVDSQGDAFFFAFRRARDAVEAAVEAQRAFAAVSWPSGVDVRIRIGIHTGEPGIVEAGYHGLDVVRAARISGSAHGGQIVVSSAARDLVGEAVPEVTFMDLGEHSLPGLERPERIFQVVAPGLVDAFPPVMAEEGARVMTIGGREAELAAAAEAAVENEAQRAQRFRRSRVIAAAAALLIVGASAAVGLALTTGSEPGITVVPNSVAVIDPESNRVVADVPVGARPIAVAVGDGAVWVANADDGTVSRIDPETRKVVNTIGIGGEVSDLAAGYGAVWVAGGNDETLTRIDPDLNAVEAPLTFGAADPLSPRPMFVVATGANAVWATRGNNVLRIDPDTNERTTTIPVDLPLSIAVGEGSAWVTSTSERLLRIEPRTGDVTARIPVPSQTYELVVGGGAVWAIVNIGNGEIWSFDPDTGSPSGSIPNREIPLDLAYGSGTLWAANLRNGSVSRINPSTREIVQTVPLGQAPTGIAVGEGAVWVTVESADAT